MDTAFFHKSQPGRFRRVQILPPVVERQSMALKMQKNSPSRHAELACFLPENGRARSGKPGKIVEKIEKKFKKNSTKFVYQGILVPLTDSEDITVTYKPTKFHAKIPRGRGVATPTKITFNDFDRVSLATSKRPNLLSQFSHGKCPPSFSKECKKFVTITTKLAVKFKKRPFWG